MESPQLDDDPQRIQLVRSSSQAKPKGILKNATSPSQPNHNLTWDEANIALTEIQKDSLMKITEPKTPYVRSNELSEEVEGDIPSMNLGESNYFPPIDPQSDQTAANTAFNSAPNNADSSSSSRRASIQSVNGTRRSSSNSSRSTSFSLPTEATAEIRAGSHDVGEEVGEDEEMDGESAAKHAAFVRARGRHYSNEAEAMKKAAALIADEDTEEHEGTPQEAEVAAQIANDSDLGKVSINGVMHDI